MDTFQQVQLHQLLLSLGKVAALNMYADASSINKQLLSFDSHFKPYNPRKSGYNRYGLSITSQDGGFAHVPNLDSLSEYNKEHGTNFGEGDFRKWTPFFEACQELREMMTPFHKHMGRSHILRLNKGGFSPPHRDGMTLIPTHFRLLISLSHSDNFVFLLDNERVFFRRGWLYFFNTQLAHTLFSFTDKNDFIVFNIDLCEDSIRSVLNNLAVR